MMGIGLSNYPYFDAGRPILQSVPFNINSMHFLLFKPELFLIISLIALLILTVFLRNYYRVEDIALYSYLLTIYILVVTMIMSLQNLIYKSSFIIFNFALVIDYYSTIVKSALLFLAIITLLATLKKIKLSYIDLIEYPWLIGLSIFFLMTLISSYNMISLYLSIEGLSLTLYVLTAYPFSKSSMEAASKYYVFGAWSSGILLAGILGLYGLYGVFDFLTLTQNLCMDTNEKGFHLKELVAFLIVFGFIFKLGMYPFHM
jgi:NADH-quinone oxidoreductase subunit N